MTKEVEVVRTNSYNILYTIYPTLHHRDRYSRSAATGGGTLTFYLRGEVL